MTVFSEAGNTYRHAGSGFSRYPVSPEQFCSFNKCVSGSQVVEEIGSVAGMTVFFKPMYGLLPPREVDYFLHK